MLFATVEVAEVVVRYHARDGALCSIFYERDDGAMVVRTDADGVVGIGIHRHISRRCM